MNNPRYFGMLCVASFLSSSPGAEAIDDLPVAISLDYQLRRLATPTPDQRAAEKRGAVYLYDSLDAVDVDAALDQHFDRIQNMMFIRIHHLPAAGAGPADVDDDCD